MKSVRGILGILAMTLLLLMMPAASQKVYAAWDGSVATEFAGGDGSAGDPYLIETPAQLAWLGYCVDQPNQNGGYGAEKYFRLTADIDLGDRDWTPIGLNSSQFFAGYFDGDGHTITQLHVSGGLPGGLFGYVDGGARIQNLTVRGQVQCNVSPAGGIVGYLGNGSVVGCTSFVSVDSSSTSGDSYAGGIVGQIQSASAVVADCANKGYVSAHINEGDGRQNDRAIAGGIVGYSDVAGITIKNCNNTGMCFANCSGTTNSYNSGILGLYEGSTCTIVSCCSSGTLSASHKDAISWTVTPASPSYDGPVTFITCYWKNPDGGSYSYHGTERDTTAYATENSFTGMNFHTTWKMTTNGPELRAATAADPRQPVTWGELAEALSLGGYVEPADSVSRPDSALLLSVPVGVTATLDLYGVNGDCWVMKNLWDSQAIYRADHAEDDGSVIDAYGILTITTLDGDGENVDHGVIREGWTGYTQAGYGGGVYVHSGAAFILEGGSIAISKATTGGGGVYVDNGGLFRMTGGDLFENITDGDGGNVYVAGGGVFEMSGGLIANGKASGNGGGVYVASGGVFRMTDGSIESNSAEGNGGGVYIAQGGRFELSGHEFMDNGADRNGGAVYVSPGSTFKVSGSFLMRMGTSDSNDVYLPTGAVITIDGPLEHWENSGVIYELTMETPGVFTEGWSDYMAEANPDDYFSRFYDNAGEFYDAGGNLYETDMRDGELVMVAHSFSYSVSGATITATCPNAGCLTAPGGVATLTIVAPQKTSIGDNKSPQATLRDTGGFLEELEYQGQAISAADIRYVGVNGTNYPSSATAPTGIGTYTASITTCGKTASVTYTISGNPMRVYGRNATGAYTGIPRTITVNVLEPAEGATITYGTTAGTYDLTENPGFTEVGTHTTYFKVSAEGYADYTGSATVTIRKAGIPITGFTAPKARKLYVTGEAQELVTAGSSNVGTLVYASGTADAATGDYSATIPTATEAGTYYVWFRVYGDSNHLDSAEFKVAVTISAEAPDPDPDDDPVDDGQVSSFVTRMYEVFLDRTPDEEEVTFWTTLLDQGTQTAGETAAGFIFSTEFSNRNMCNSHFLDYLYLGLFGRPADEEGKAGWLLLMDEGYSREMVAQGFLTSTEFYDLCDRYEVYAGRGMATVPKLGTIQKAHCTIEGCTVESPVRVMVVNLYDTVFGRVPSEEEVEFWVEIMASHNPEAPARVMVNTFLNGDEYALLNRDNSAYVTDLYAAIFGREPDEAGYEQWLGALESGALTREEVLDNFIGSPEFIDQCHHAGIAVGIGDQ
ncbi:MAG: DUF4214 domain-containing protein [Lachnospiraceae bacterium]|nr:DUF4214 domain-containing protein [Lachnospiraceae bacterium]